MNKGFSLPIVLIVALFLSLPVMFFVFSSRSSMPKVKGVATTSNVGFDVQISSGKGTWDLFEFLCTTKEECSSSLTSGKRLETISGGQVKTYDVVVEPDQAWNEYKYIKLFVKPGWGSPFRTFTVANKAQIPNVEFVTLTEGNGSYNAIIIPISSVQNSFYSPINFSD
jgi:hypothetical protein